jgi:predicted GNAT family acetyltransferase
MPQGIFKLTKLADVPMPAGSFRLASDADLDLTSAWYAAFTREADLPANERANPDEARIFAGTLTKAGTLYVWCDENGDAVAMANRARETPGGSCLNLVYTPRDKRGRGYAGAVCWHLSKKILDEGRFAFLYTDLRNPVSNGLYKKLGYKAVGDQGSYAFGKEAPGE